MRDTEKEAEYKKRREEIERLERHILNEKLNSQRELNEITRAKRLADQQLEDERKRLEEERNIKEIEKATEKLKKGDYNNFSDIIENIDRISFFIAYHDDKKIKTYDTSMILDDHENKIEKTDNELKIKQNKINFKISPEKNDGDRIAKFTYGTHYEIYDHDSSGYYLLIRLLKDEMFLKKLIITHIRLCYPKMSILPSNFTISAFLESELVNEQDASNILKRIAKNIFDEMKQFGDIVVIRP